MVALNSATASILLMFKNYKELSLTAYFYQTMRPKRRGKMLCANISF